MTTIGADRAHSLGTVDLYTSHEGLHLEYEQSLTRSLKDPVDGKNKWFNTSAHFIWIGDRTRQLDGSHVEYFRGIENPIGIKVGPTMKNDELVALLDIVNPSKEIGKVTLITRYGKDKIHDLLPGHIKGIQGSGHVVIWSVLFKSQPNNGLLILLGNAIPCMGINFLDFYNISTLILTCYQKHSFINYRSKDSPILVYNGRAFCRPCHP